MAVLLQYEQQVFEVAFAAEAPISVLTACLRQAGIDVETIRFVYEGQPISGSTFAECGIVPGARIVVESTLNRFNYKSFTSGRFDDLDTQIQTWLRLVNKRVLTIAYGFDGFLHHALLATNPTEVVITDRSGRNYAYVDDRGFLETKAKSF